MIEHAQPMIRKFGIGDPVVARTDPYECREYVGEVRAVFTTKFNKGSDIYYVVECDDSGHLVIVKEWELTPKKARAYG